MTIDTTCPSCGTMFTLRRELIGKRTKCTNCGTPFVITATQASPQPPRPAPQAAPHVQQQPPLQHQPLFPDIPLGQSYPTSGIPATPLPPTHSTVGAGAIPSILGSDRAPSRPKYAAMRLIARAYEVMAVFCAIAAAVAIVAFLVTVIRNPQAIFQAIVTSGMAVLSALGMALMSLFIAQAIRLGLQIEQNTHDTSEACRRLADHLTAIETER